VRSNRSLVGSVMIESPRRPWLPLFLFVVVVFLLIASEAGYLTPAENASHYVLDPLQRAFSSVTEFAGNLFQTRREVRELRVEVEELREQVDVLAVENVRLKEYEAEVQTLRAMLNFASEYPVSTFVGADVVSREAGEVVGEEPNPYLRYVTINVGSQQGIDVGMSVISGGGALIGRVAQVAPRTAKVQLLTDRESAVAALLQTSRATGLVVGQPDGTLRMEYIPQAGVVGVGGDANELEERENVSIGDVVLTSGLGGFIPKGLVIGQVTEVQQMDYEVFQAAVVRPAIDFSRLELVLVITSFEQIPLEGQEELEPTPELP
jgi:rod shape-determining protein MreC